jgi:hypothetical protein
MELNFRDETFASV